MSTTPSPPPVNLAELASRAREHLDASALAYFDGGAGDELTVAANRADWDALRLWPRVLQPIAPGHTGLQLHGRPLAHPLMLAPVAYQRLAHPEGELATAMAAAAQGAGMVLSMQSSVSLEAVAGVMQGDPDAGPLWFQLAMLASRAQTLALVRRAESAGCEALVLTVDAPLHGARDRERRAGFRLPPGVRAVNLPSPAQGPGLSELLAQAASWDDVAWLRAETRLPLWLKGVLHPDDARTAVSLGVDGLVVSNHGGRTLDSCVSTAWALPRVADALQGAVPLLVDGGIRRGTDVVKALALGAQAVLVGRPQVHALACAGALGVAQMLRLLRDELSIALALCGCRALSDVKRSLLA